MAFSSVGSASLRVGRLGLVGLLVGAGAAGIACGTEDGRTGVRGDPSASGTGSTGNGSGGVIGVPGTGPGDGSTGPNGKEYCQEADVEFRPRTPTVLVLVDRSSSMFDHTDFWGQLKTAVLPVIEDLQSDVRFGFATYTGQMGGATCPELQVAPEIKENNYEDIAALYNDVVATTHKGETPTPAAIQEAKDILLNDPSPGDRFILLVTDGEPDFCDDPAAKCGADALVASLQIAAAAGVRTLVFGIENTDINAEWFSYYAQAGLGQQPSWADGLDVEEYTGLLQSQCSQYAYWGAMRSQNGNSGEYDPAGKYSPEGGTAAAILNTDPAALAEQIRTGIEGLKSCTFNLADSNVEVKPGSESQGEIFVAEKLIPADQWRMNDSITLELLGAACDEWQKPEVTQFFAGFPCDAIIIR